MTEKNTNKSSDLNKKARNAMFIVAVLNVISGYITKSIGYLCIWS